jgi:hypothetical protein
LIATTDEMKENRSIDPNGEPEETLVAPRFDAEAAETAHPVVPLAQAQGRPPTKRPWPLALIVVSVLAVAAAGAIVSALYRRSQSSSAPTPTELTADEAFSENGKISEQPASTQPTHRNVMPDRPRADRDRSTISEEQTVLPVAPRILRPDEENRGAQRHDDETDADSDVDSDRHKRKKEKKGKQRERAVEVRIDEAQLKRARQEVRRLREVFKDREPK